MQKDSVIEDLNLNMENSFIAGVAHNKFQSLYPMTYRTLLSIDLVASRIAEESKKRKDWETKYGEKQSNNS